MVNSVSSMTKSVVKSLPSLEKGMNKIVNDSQFRRDFANKTVKMTLSLKDREKLKGLLVKAAMVTAAVKKITDELKNQKKSEKRGDFELEKLKQRVSSQKSATYEELAPVFQSAFGNEPGVGKRIASAIEKTFSLEQEEIPKTVDYQNKWREISAKIQADFQADLPRFTEDISQQLSDSFKLCLDKSWEETKKSINKQVFKNFLTKAPAEFARIAYVKYLNFPQTVKRIPEDYRQLKKELSQVKKEEVKEFAKEFWDYISTSYKTMADFSRRAKEVAKNKELNAVVGKINELPEENFLDKSYDLIVDYLNLKGVAPETFDFRDVSNSKVLAFFTPLDNTISLTSGLKAKSKEEQVSMIAHELTHCAQFTAILRTEGIGLEQVAEALVQSAYADVPNISEDELRKEQSNVIEKLKENYADVLKMPKFGADSPEGKKALVYLDSFRTYKGPSTFSMNAYLSNPLEGGAYGTEIDFLRAFALVNKPTFKEQVNSFIEVFKNPSKLVESLTLLQNVLKNN